MWRYTANPYRSAIPSILLTIVHSLDNKMDLIHLLRTTQYNMRECCILVFTKTWLNGNIPDNAIQLDRLTCYQAYRALGLGGNTCGGGVCVYISNAWRRDAGVVRKHCSPLTEFMIVQCQRFIYQILQQSCWSRFTFHPATTVTKMRHSVNCIMPSMSNSQPILMDF